MSETIFNVDATALFFTAPAPDPAALLETLNAAFADTEGCYLTKSPLSHAGWWLLSCTQFHIMIGFEDVPAPMARFAQAVTSPITRLNRFAYEHAAQNHNLHLTIEIGDGHAPLPPEARRIMQEFGAGATCEPALKMKALHLTSQFIADHPGFLALHFAPSDRLVSADDLRAVRGQDVPLDLLLHPVPTEVDIDAHGRETWALRLRNPHHLPGPAIEIEGIPRSVPLATAVNLLRSLTRAHAAGKLALKEGDTISPTGKWALHAFRIAPEAGTPQGRIVLSFYKDRVGYAPLVTDPGLKTAETAPQDTSSAFAARALAALRKSEAVAVDPAPKAPTPQRHVATQNVPLVALSPEEEKPAAARGHAPAPASASAPTSTTAPKLAPAEDTPPRDSANLLGWIVARCKSLPRENRATGSGIALVLALSTLANPYAGFTGGHDTLPGPQHGIATSAPTPETFAALLLP